MAMLRRAVLFLLLLCLAVPAAAQKREAPYWATLRFDEVNMRVGPGEDYKIDWVYRRKGLPVKVVRLVEGWRLVEEPDGSRGWIAETLLSLNQGAIVIGEGLAELRAEPAATARLLWRAEPGVVGKLGECRDGWCLFTVGRREGWARAARLWGAGEP
jgi:SH3-like domain-containing protein